MTKLNNLAVGPADHARRLRRVMAHRLTEPEDPWRDAFVDVPRHVFAPQFLRQGARGRWETITPAEADYLKAVYADTALTTQLTRGAPTSSTSQPSLMLSMLHALDVQGEQNVLEIGTGTGYNAALLAYRLDDEHVTTIDVDPVLTGTAAQHLTQAGYRPCIHTGDGAAGVPERAPFDRIIATCGLQSVPWSWIEQSASSAVIVAPIGSGLARIIVRDGTAEGRFLAGGACFMPRRSASVAPRFGDLDDAPTEQSEIPVADSLDRLAFPLSLALPGYRSCTWTDDTREFHAVGIWTLDGSVARAQADGTVQQTGPRRLWKQVERLHALFPGEAPAREDFGLTLTREGQRAWFRDPDGPGWDLPTAVFD